MLQLFQTEWCRGSQRVRQRLTELGLDFVARQVPEDPEERDVLEFHTGVRSVPVLVFVIAPPGKANLDAGPLRAEPGHFHVLEPGKIEEQLAGLS